MYYQPIRMWEFLPPTLTGPQRLKGVIRDGFKDVTILTSPIIRKSYDFITTVGGTNYKLTGPSRQQLVADARKPTTKG
jgi:hypothetical protein